ncbi:MAG: hypothetical protein IPP25_03195 [Saprospiraceae bacterium]|nr:hypothetical protein [Candidatus Opimibacter skivensis]
MRFDLKMDDRSITYRHGVRAISMATGVPMVCSISSLEEYHVADDKLVGTFITYIASQVECFCYPAKKLAELGSKSIRITSPGQEVIRPKCKV